MFENRKKKAVGGYFVHRGKHVLYKITDKVESFLPSLEKIKNTVKQDLYLKKSRGNLKTTVQKIKRELLTTSASLESVAQKNSLKIIKTGLIKSSDTPEDLKDAGNIIEEAFILNDKYPVLVHDAKSNDRYLVRLVNSQPGEKKKGDEPDDLMKSQAKRRNSEAFLEALKRSAKISINKEFLGPKGLAR